MSSITSQCSQLSFSPLLLEAVLNKVHLADTGYSDCLSVPLHPEPLGCLSCRDSYSLDLADRLSPCVNEHIPLAP